MDIIGVFPLKNTFSIELRARKYEFSFYRFGYRTNGAPISTII